MPLPLELERAFEVELEAASRLLVRVTEPCPGLAYRLSAEGTPFADGARRLDELARAASVGRPDRSTADAEGTVEAIIPAAGEFELIGLQPGTPLRLELLDVLGEAAGALELNALTPAEERRVTLAPELPFGRLVGRTRIEGAGAMVGQMLVLSTPTGGRVALRTGPTGEFDIQGIAARSVDLEIAKPGFVRVELRDQPVDRDQPPLDVRLERGVVLRIQVSDANGSPIEGARASATRAGDERVWQAREREPGRLEIPDVPASRELRIELRAGDRTVVRRHDPLAGELRVEL